ncbi:hypothetical protein [Helicobacter turcicus]|nr:hypothetical protein [Helicobacter turcicus]
MLENVLKVLESETAIQRDNESPKHFVKHKKSSINILSNWQ